MKEIHIAPMTVEGNFHTGKIMEVFSADLYARWALFTQHTTSISIVHDSWNTYIDERNTQALLNREDIIMSYKSTKNQLSLLPSADVVMNENEVVSLEPQQFRDDDADNVAVVNDALHQLRSKNIVIPGVVEGFEGLYLDIDILANNEDVIETLDGVDIFPSRYKNVFKRSIDKNNKSNYLGKIPITKRRVHGLPVDRALLESDNYYYDERFSKVNYTDDESKLSKSVCVSPLVVLALLPHIRESLVGNRQIDYITNGSGSSLRFNMISLLINPALGVNDPYNKIHLFGKLVMDEPTTEEEYAKPQFAAKMRYVIFDQLSQDSKTIPLDYANIDRNDRNLVVREFDIFNKRLTYMRNVMNYYLAAGLPMLDTEGRNYLTELGIFDAMDKMDYARAFKIMKSEIVKRSKRIKEGVSKNDYVLMKVADLFLPSSSF